MRVLMTAFGPFGNFRRNPSEMVLEYIQERENKNTRDCVIDCEVLPVAFAATDQFIAGIRPSAYDVVIHTGVAVGSLRPQIELQACNRVKGRDVHGVALEGVIDRQGPALVTSPLALHVCARCEECNVVIETSEDAGAYLCNYIYYKSLCFLGQQTGIVFIHLADFVSEPNASNLEVQAKFLMRVLKFVR